MATSGRTVEFLLDQLGGVAGMRARKMFGEYALYCPGAKAALLVGAGDLEDHDRLAELIRVTAAALPAPRPKAKKKARTTAPKKAAARGQKKGARARR